MFWGKHVEEMGPGTVHTCLCGGTQVLPTNLLWAACAQVPEELDGGCAHGWGRCMPRPHFTHCGDEAEQRLTDRLNVGKVAQDAQCLSLYRNLWETVDTIRA